MKKQNQGGRPTLAELDIERVLIRISLTLHEGEDDDLILFLIEKEPTTSKSLFDKEA